MIWWLVLSCALFELVILLGAWFRGHHGGHYSPGGGFVAVHVWLFGGFIASLVMSAELVAHVWVRADLPHRTGGTVRQAIGQANSPRPESSDGGSTTSNPAACNRPRSRGVSGFSGG